jgi:hypothetical protein
MATTEVVFTTLDIPQAMRHLLCSPSLVMYQLPHCSTVNTAGQREEKFAALKQYLTRFEEKALAAMHCALPIEEANSEISTHRE